MNKVLLPLAAAMALLTPIVCQARDISIPEIGVTFLGAPENTSAPMLHPDLNGEEGIVRMGEALVVVYRGSDTVAPKAAVTDEGFRASLQSMPDLIIHSRSKGALTSLAGRRAWAFYDVYASEYLVDYVLVVYVIIDEHLYILQVAAHTPSKKSPDFDVAVRTLQNASFFLPVHGSGHATNFASTPGTGSLHHVRHRVNEILYPPRAQRLGEQGEVDMEFRIDRGGHPRDVRETYAATRDLGAAAERQIRTLRFDVPRDWAESGSDNRIIQAEFQFSLRCRADSPAIYPPRVVGASVISVCAQLLPHGARPQ